MKTFWARLLSIYICCYCSLLSAQEISPDIGELVDRPMSFLEFVGWMERADDLWISLFDLQEGFFIEEVAIPANTDPDSTFITTPLESVEP